VLWLCLEIPKLASHADLSCVFARMSRSGRLLGFCMSCRLLTVSLRCCRVSCPSPSLLICPFLPHVCRFKGPLTLLDGFFHMHGLGTSIITRRFRNGTELSPLAQLRMFDYEFQVPGLQLFCVPLPRSACCMLHVTCTMCILLHMRTCV
jgi:hypothetical protein